MDVFRNDEIEFTIEDAAISNNFWKMIMPESKDYKDVGYTIIYTRRVQARKHHKKRINKKWLKRYGYKLIQEVSSDWHIDEISGGQYTFIKEGEL